MGSAGLHAAWTYSILRDVGNYGEIYERNLGAKSAAKTAARLEPLMDRRRPALRSSDSMNLNPHDRRLRFLVTPLHMETAMAW